MTGDGGRSPPARSTTIFPGPLLPNVLQRSITPGRLQELLAKADELGLLADVEYENPTNIADAGTTSSTITVDGPTYHHEAYALGLDPRARRPGPPALAEFVDADAEPAGDRRRGRARSRGAVRARAVPDPGLARRPRRDRRRRLEPTFVAWPADAPVRLADAASAPPAAAELGPLFADATTLTFFTEPDQIDGSEVTYSVTPVQQLPGRSC